jgi:hypothetical protein
MIVLLQGGLGNQMFQYAFGRSVARARNEELLFQKRPDMDAPGSRMAYSLGAFETTVTFASKDNCDFQVTGPRYEEPMFAYDNKVYGVPKDTLFIGYWQTEKYFDAKILDEFYVRAPLSAQTQRLAEEITAAADSVFIHVRRTDYLLPMNSWMGIMPMSYYAQAANYLQSRCFNAKFFVFSDDPEWCRQNFPPSFRIVDHNKAGTSGNGPGQEHEDLLLMSLCCHAIIANSSFGWWGAWLGDFLGKIVVAPNQWFNGTLGGRWTPETSDIVPARWVKL